MPLNEEVCAKFIVNKLITVNYTLNVETDSVLFCFNFLITGA